MNDCVFCKIVRKELPAQIVYEDKHCLAFLSIQPVQKGHTLLIPKSHKKDVHELSDDDLQHLLRPLKLLATSVKKGVSAKGVNIAMNNGKTAGQEVFHAHIHIIPRHGNDGLIDWKHTTYTDDMPAYAEAIKAAVKRFK